MKVELVFEKTCPNISAARAQIIRAFETLQLEPHWQEWEVSDVQTPDYAQNYGSPTVLVNGEDVAGEIPNQSSACCRIYSNNTSNRGVPTMAQIVSKLQQAGQAESTIVADIGAEKQA